MKTTPLKYQVVESALRQHVKTLPPGARIPSERNLAVTYQCSFLTIRKALKSMVEDGTIFRKVGNGSFVALRREPSRHYFQIPAKGYRVGVLVYQQSNAYAQKVLQMLSVAATDKKMELRPAWTGSFGQEALDHANHFAEAGCSAIILPWFPHDMTGEISGFIQKCPLPVSIPLVIPGLEKNYFGEVKTFGADLITSMESLHRYFQQLGHHNIAFLGPTSPKDPVLQTMLSAYTCLIQERNLASICGLVAPGSRPMDQLAERWKAYHKDLAIISYDDEHALRFMTAMHKIGLSAPADYKIIGHNNTEASHFSDPPLSTISQDFYHVGVSLLETAAALSQGRTYKAEDDPIVKVLVRKTCGGFDKITPSFRKEFPTLEFIEDPKDETKLSEEKKSQEIALA